METIECLSQWLIQMEQNTTSTTTKLVAYKAVSNHNSDVVKEIVYDTFSNMQ